MESDENNEYDETDRARDVAIDVLKILTPVAACAKVIMKEELIPALMKLLYADIFATRIPMLDLLTRLCETSDVVAECRKQNVVLLALYCLCREQDQVGPHLIPRRQTNP